MVTQVIQICSARVKSYFRSTEMFLCPPATKFLPKVPPKKKRYQDKAKFATKLRKLSKECVQ